MVSLRSDGARGLIGHYGPRDGHPFGGVVCDLRFSRDHALRITADRRRINRWSPSDLTVPVALLVTTVPVTVTPSAVLSAICGLAETTPCASLLTDVG